MKLITEETTGTLHRDPDGRWFARTGVTGKAYLDDKLQGRPNPNLDGTEVGVVLQGFRGHNHWTVTDYRFL